MKIAIAGSGAMGCRFGSLLHESGNDVLLIDRWPEHIKNIQEKGLQIVNEKGTHTDFIPVSYPEKSKGDFDLIIVLTKDMQTIDMMTACKHLIGENTYVLTLQNGLGNVETLEKFVKRDKLIAGITTFGTALMGPGKIQALGTGLIQIMQVDGIKTPKIEEINAAFNKANMHSSISEDVFSSIWTKVALNCVLNPICTLMRSPIAAVAKCSEINDVSDAIVDEIILVGRAEKVNLDKNKIMTMIRNVFDPATCGNHLPSMAQDMKNGRKTEIEYLNGAIADLGKKHNISTPANKMISDLIKMMEQTR